MPVSGEKYFFIGSLAKGIKIMELLAEQKQLTVSGVAKLLGSNRAASHRFLATLRELGYVEKDEEDRYRLTFKVFELGMKVANRFEIRQIARPLMQELALAFRETGTGQGRPRLPAPGRVRALPLASDIETSRAEHYHHEKAL
jgi:DNA-binding transcriptional ArsR family regulator